MQQPEQVALTPEQEWKLKKAKIVCYGVVGLYAVTMSLKIGCDMFMPKAEDSDSANSMSSSDEAQPTCVNTLLNIVANTMSRHGPIIFLGAGAAVGALYCWMQPVTPLLRREAHEDVANRAERGLGNV